MLPFAAYVFVFLQAAFAAPSAGVSAHSVDPSLARLSSFLGVELPAVTPTPTMSKCQDLSDVEKLTCVSRALRATENKVERLLKGLDVLAENIPHETDKLREAYQDRLNDGESAQLHGELEEIETGIVLARDVLKLSLEELAIDLPADPTELNKRQLARLISDFEVNEYSLFEAYIRAANATRDEGWQLRRIRDGLVSGYTVNKPTLVAGTPATTTLSP